MTERRAPYRVRRTRRLQPTEAQVLRAVLRALALHRRVAWVARMNVGAMEREHGGRRRYVRFGFRGCPDIIGQLKDGRLLAVECKAPGRYLTREQAAFLRRVQTHGGVAGVARSIDDVLVLLEAL